MIYQTINGRITMSQKEKTVRFVKLSDGWVRDAKTGLEWGQSSPDMMNWEKAKAYCKSVGGRLPTVMELESLVDRTKHEPAIDKDSFPGIKSSWYWTSESVAGHSSSAWCVSFHYGDVDSGHKGNDNYVCPVRSSQ